MKPLKLLVVDDQSLFREGVVRLLTSQKDMEVVAQASDGREALEKAQVCRPDIVLLDIRMPVMDGLEATRLIKQELPGTKVVILTVSDAEKDLFEALKNGAIGYLLKSIKAETLFQKIREVAQGETALSPVIASRVVQEFARLKRQEEATATDLSERECQILQMVTQGQSNREIGEALFITEATVKRHLHNILQKLHAKNRAEASAYGVRAGLVKPPSP